MPFFKKSTVFKHYFQMYLLTIIHRMETQNSYRLLKLLSIIARNSEN